MIFSGAAQRVLSPLGTIEEGKIATEKLLKMDNPPDAIFSTNDPAAMGAMQAIKESGLKIPKDIAVVGFSNWFFSALMDPPLTSVDQPGFEMGQEAAKLLRTKKYKVFEVVYMVGFSDLKYFRQCFTKEFGYSPSDFIRHASTSEGNVSSKDK